MSTLTISEKGQIDIPSAVRRKYGLHPGTRVRLVERSHELAIQPDERDIVDQLCGIFEKYSSPDDTAGDELLRERAKDKRKEDALLREFGPR